MFLLGNWVSGSRVYTPLEGLPHPEGLQPLQGLPPLEGLPPGRTTNPPPRITIPLPEGLPLEGLQSTSEELPLGGPPPQKDYPSPGRTTFQKNYQSPPFPPEGGSIHPTGMLPCFNCLYLLHSQLTCNTH